MYWHYFLIGTFVLALVHIVPGLRNLFYVHVLFEKRSRPARSARPARAGVFVPCKGAFPELADNLEAVACQEYENFTVTYISESYEDPAIRAIERVVRRHPHCRHVVAGPAVSCGQKNHNLLKGLAQDSGSELFVFCDADIRPPREWLSMLVSSLTADDVSVASGFRWLTPARRTLAGTLHSMVVAYQGAFMSCTSTRAVWGGATAIRSSTFEKLGVADEWSRTVVDDMTLLHLLRRKRMSVVYDPRCLVVSNNAVSSVREVVEWLTRQILFLKFCVRPFWFAALATHIPTALLMLAAGPLIVAGLFCEPLRPLGFICLGFSLVVMGAHTSLKLTCRDGQSVLRWFVLTPVLQLMGAFSLVKTAFMSSIRWGDATYRLDGDGRVVAVQKTERDRRTTPAPEEDSRVQ